MLPLNGQWINQQKVYPKLPRVVMRPIGGGRFVKTREYKHPSLSNIYPVRVAKKGKLDATYNLLSFAPATINYLDAAYNLLSYAPHRGYVTGSFKLGTFSKALTNKLDASYNLASYKQVSSGINAAFNILSFTDVKTGKVNARYDLFSYKAQTSRLNAGYNVLSFAGVISELDAVYALQGYQQKASYLNTQYALNSFIPKISVLDNQYAINVYQAKTGKVNAAYTLSAFSSIRTSSINAQYNLLAYASKTGFLHGVYNLNAYQTVVGIVDGFYALLANESFFGWCMNLTTGAVSKYEGLSYNSMSGMLGADATGIYNLYGADDNGTSISSFIETGSIKLGEGSNLTRAVDAYLGMKGGKLKLTMTDEKTGDTAYIFTSTTKMMTNKVNLGRGCKGKYWKLKLENVAGSTVAVDSIELNAEELSRRI